MLPKREGVPTISIICRHVIDTLGIEYNNNTHLKIENFKKRNGIKATKHTVVLGILFHEDKILNTDKLELDLTIIVRNKSLQVNRIRLLMAKPVYLGNLSGFQSILIKPKNVRISDRKTKLFYFPTTKISVSDVLKNQGFRNSNQRDMYISLYDYLHFSLVSRFILLHDHLNIVKQQANNQIQAGFQMAIISEIMFLIEDLFTLLISFKRRNKPYFEILNSTKYNLGDQIKKYISSLNNYQERDYFQLLSYDYNSYQQAVISRKISKVVNENIKLFKEDLVMLTEFSKEHHPIFRMYKHGGFPFSAPHKDKLLQNFDFYSLILIPGPYSEFIMIPFSNEVIEFYKRIYKVLYRILFNLILNKMELIRRGTEIIPFFRYDLTKPLEKGCTGEMNKYYSKNAERYVNPFYFPHTFPKEKVNNRITGYYRDAIMSGGLAVLETTLAQTP